MLRFIAKALVVMFLLPALGLIVFHGGFFYALLAALVLGFTGFVVRVVLLPALASIGLASLFAGAALGGPLGALAVVFVIESLLFSGALALAAAMLSGVALVGFWATIGAGAILALTSSLFSRR